MATYHGITKAICINCGKVTTDETQLEILNDLDPTCAVCDVHAVAWHTSKGVVVTAQKTTEEDAETERFAILETEERLCQLCGEQIKDLSKGAVVLPWGETCGDCLKEIKK